MEAAQYKILVVEDVEIAQKMAIYILSKLNCKVIVAENGIQTLGLIKSQVYDLIFMDIGLPDIDGTTVTETIRRTDNINQKTPIIALTAHSADDPLMETCINAGMNDFLTKPLTLKSANAIIEKYIKYFSSAQQLQGDPGKYY